MLLSTTDRDFHRLEAKMDLLLEAAGLTLNLELDQMSETSDFADKILAALNDEGTKITAVGDKLTALLNSSPTLSDADKAELQSVLDTVTAHSTSLDTLANETVAPVSSTPADAGTDATNAGAATA